MHFAKAMQPGNHEPICPELAMHVTQKSGWRGITVISHRGRARGLEAGRKPSEPFKSSFSGLLAT